MTGIYRDVMPAIVRVLAADAIDNTARMNWNRLIDRKVDGGFRALLSAQDQFEFDCILHALLHRELSSGEWDVLHARYSTNNGRRLQAIGRLVPRIQTPAPHLFLTRAVSAWAIPKMKGKEGKRSTDVLILSDEYYDMNQWDTEARPDSTRNRWRRDIRKQLEQLEEEALVHVTEILDREKLLDVA
ncbi:TPA: hypothetical protein ACKRK9_005204 [Pseudomonas aeruginosa]|uniref:hypothetical protein n=1 Tax=Pseudomonas aeruginosa TaxID=287 RepID=UPI000F5464D9|nr:hypothetical protein [Pseudomonas aeruginosa]RPS59479.1 hypothetical protein IPC991_30315 [Pseudomonas aeruginosa]HEH8727232.1 hypothetical protein [Pseudomonas aeruginosa]